MENQCGEGFIAMSYEWVEVGGAKLNKYVDPWERETLKKEGVVKTGNIIKPEEQLDEHDRVGELYDCLKDVSLEGFKTSLEDSLKMVDKDQKKEEESKGKEEEEEEDEDTVLEEIKERVKLRLEKEKEINDYFDECIRRHENFIIETQHFIISIQAKQATDRAEDTKREALIKELGDWVDKQKVSSEKRRWVKGYLEKEKDRIVETDRFIKECQDDIKITKKEEILAYFNDINAGPLEIEAVKNSEDGDVIVYLNNSYDDMLE